MSKIYVEVSTSKNIVQGDGADIIREVNDILMSADDLAPGDLKSKLYSFVYDLDATIESISNFASEKTLRLTVNDSPIFINITNIIYVKIYGVKETLEIINEACDTYEIRRPRKEDYEFLSLYM